MTHPRTLDEIAEEAEFNRRYRIEAAEEAFIRMHPGYVGASLSNPPAESPDLADAYAKFRAWFDGSGLVCILHGPPGRGKTHAAYALKHDLMTDGRWPNTGCHIADWEDLVDAWGYNARTDQMAQDQATLRKRAEAVDVLVINDISRAKVTEHTGGRLAKLVENRAEKRFRTIMTANWPGPGEPGFGQEVRGPLGERNASRLLTGTWVKFDGPELRQYYWNRAP